MGLNSCSSSINGFCSSLKNSLFLGVDALYHHEVLDNAYYTQPNARLGHIVIQTAVITAITCIATYLLLGVIASVFFTLATALLTFAALTAISDHRASISAVIQAADNLDQHGSDCASSLGAWTTRQVHRLDEAINADYSYLRGRPVNQRPWFQQAISFDNIANGLASLLDSD